MVGELDAEKPHVQFDEGAQETCDSATRLCPTLPKPLVIFRSAAQMLDTFGMAKGGKEYRRLVAAFERLGERR
jgi:hypothetical protein